MRDVRRPIACSIWSSLPRCHAPARKIPEERHGGDNN